MFHPSWSGEDLAVLALVNGNNIAGLIKHDKPRAGRTLVDRRYIFAHLSLHETMDMGILYSRSERQSSPLEVI
jgi:ABC-type branched-subunit amino acid transport system ATPase component